MSQLYIEIHILQDLPPSNINRDDNGTPKQAVYGGVDRLRVSSQAWKRATRLRFQHLVKDEDLGIRTRRLHGLLSELMVEQGMDRNKSVDMASQALKKIGIKMADKKNVEWSSYLLFAGRSQLHDLTRSLVTNGVDQTDIAHILGSVHPLDVALFGRMVTDMTQLNVDGAAQVAHALSTHAAKTQFDYFTAVDDLQEKDEAGAGMIGTIEFNSATVYRYATVGLDQLIENMSDTEKAIEGVGYFLTAFTESMPTGHQNSFAAHTRPSLVLVAISDHPVNLISAFESPVRASGSGYVAPSQQALARHYLSERRRWGDSPLLVAASYNASGEVEGLLEEAFGRSESMQDLVSMTTETLAKVVQEPAPTARTAT